MISNEIIEKRYFIAMYNVTDEDKTYNAIPIIQ